MCFLMRVWKNAPLWGPILMVSLLAVNVHAEEVQITPWREHASQLDWSAKLNRIAYAIKDKQGVYEVHTADPDGKNDVCISKKFAAFDHRYVGSPFWHPSGKFLVVVVEKKDHKGSQYEATPGFGGWSDVWALSADGSQAHQLTDLPNDADHGVLIPRFSPDGSQLCWTQRVARPNFFDPKQTFAYWAIKIADVVVSGENVKLENIRTYEPGGRAFYETYGFSRDGKRVIFCSSFNQPSVWTQQIFTLDAATGNDIKQLTEKDYNEHAAYTPDGKSIVWMSHVDSVAGGTDWWMMDADGRNKRRLTYFNQPFHKQYAGHAVWAGLPSFAPDGKRFIGDIQQNLITQDANTVMVEFIQK